MIIFAQRPIGSKGDRSLRERESRGEATAV